MPYRHNNLYRVFIDVNGIRLAYADTGTGTPVAVLVHGYPLNRSMWDPQIGRLRAARSRVIAPDLRGFGASEAGPLARIDEAGHMSNMENLDEVNDALVEFVESL
jgi:pimeloyl-ACP methyl ester carboxylesterase